VTLASSPQSGRSEPDKRFLNSGLHTVLAWITRSLETARHGCGSTNGLRRVADCVRSIDADPNVATIISAYALLGYSVVNYFEGEYQGADEILLVCRSPVAASVPDRPSP
jgi:hypothetical protein